MRAHDPSRADDEGVLIRPGRPPGGPSLSLTPSGPDPPGGGRPCAPERIAQCRHGWAGSQVISRIARIRRSFA